MSKEQKSSSEEHEKAVAADAVTAEQKAEALRHYRLGRSLWQQGRRGEAMTEYNISLSLDPASPAAAALDMANDIMDFFDRNLYNP